MPARSGSGPPAALPFSAWASVPVRLPAPGCTTTPAGLSTTIRVSSSSTTSNGTSAAPGVRLLGQLAPLDQLARRQPVRLGPALSVDRHRAGVDQPLRLRARRGLTARGQCRVEAHARLRGLGPEAHSRRPSTT